MSVDVYDAVPVQVWDVSHPRARIEHVCDACDGTIQRGHFYARHTVIGERGEQPEVTKRCMRCENIYVYLQVKMDRECDGEEAPDIALKCGHTYEKRWGEAPPPELARFAFMTDEELQAEFLAGGNKKLYEQHLTRQP